MRLLIDHVDLVSGVVRGGAGQGARGEIQAADVVRYFRLINFGRH